MPELTLTYRCCERRLPRYLKHSEVEKIAATTRQRLVDDQTDAISLSILRGISGLKTNGIKYDLWIDTENQVSDERGNSVLGV